MSLIHSKALLHYLDASIRAIDPCSMLPSITRPLPAHPEFSVVEYPGCHEYRLENRRPINDPHKLAFISLKSLMVVLCIGISSQILPGILFYSMATVFTILTIRATVFNILYESVILLPPHGIQLETHRGFYALPPLFSNRLFIPSASLDGVIINEGLSGWDVLYYLALVKRTNSQRSALEVAYQHLLPPHSVLLQTFEGIHEIVLFSATATTESI